MVPAGDITQSTIAELADALEGGDLVIDGGNSRFTDDAVHAELLGARGIGFLDCGVSGGIWGRENGYGLMVGGSEPDVEKAMRSSTPFAPTVRLQTALSTPVPSVLVITRRWCTTASNTA